MCESAFLNTVCRLCFEIKAQVKYTIASQSIIRSWLCSKPLVKCALYLFGTETFFKKVFVLNVSDAAYKAEAVPFTKNCYTTV